MTSQHARFDRARVVLSEPARMYGMALRSVLHGLGFRTFFAFEDVATLRAELSAANFDLWITNADLADGPVFSLVHDIRHSRVGSDIFIPVIVQSLHVNEAMAKNTLNAGADLLWRLPVTGGQITDGIDMLLHRRRPFVVTADYIGPDRRTAPRPDRMQVPLLDVPNPLREKAQVEARPPVDYVEIMRQINHQKAEAQAFQIGWLAERIVPLIGADPHDAQAKEYLSRLKVVALELMGRVVVTKYLHQAELCRALARQARQVADNPDPRRVDIFRELVKALQVAFHIVDDKQAAAALAIAQQVQQVQQTQRS